MQLLDGDRLTGFLTDHEQIVRSPVARAIYLGLNARVQRGDFDAHTADPHTPARGDDGLQEAAETVEWLTAQGFIDQGGDTP